MAINDPRDIPGLVIWYSAEAETAYANDAEMAQWTDLSGNGNHATAATTSTSKPFWRATDGPTSGPAVRFGLPGGGVGATGAYFTLPPAAFSGLTAGEVVATVKSDSTASTTSQGNWLKAGSYAGGSPYGYGGTSYDDFGSTSRKTLGTLPPINTWHRVNIWSAPSDYEFRFNGSTAFSTTTNAVGWASIPRLGNTGAPGTVTNQTVETYEGHLGCLVLYGRKLTTTERADLDAWLQANPSGGTTGPLTPTLVLSGTTPAVTGTFDVSVAVPPVDITLGGTAPQVTGSFSLTETGVAFLDLAGTSPAVFGSFGITASGAPVEVATDSVDRGNGMTLVTEWLVEVTPPITEPKRKRGHDYATATSISSPTFVDGRPT